MSKPTKPFQELTFLVVDDDPKGLDMIVTLLKHYGANTISANNGATGLEFARQLKPDMIISDLSMPIMNGWKMIAELKQDRATMHIPIIALTAHAMRGDREKAIAAGCHNYITKPIDPYNFLDQLQGIVDEIPEMRDSNSSKSEEASEAKKLESVSNPTEALTTEKVENQLEQDKTEKSLPVSSAAEQVAKDLSVKEPVDKPSTEI